jgi:hypothetical protein
MPFSIRSIVAFLCTAPSRTTRAHSDVTALCGTCPVRMVLFHGGSAVILNGRNPQSAIHSSLFGLASQPLYRCP